MPEENASQFLRDHMETQKAGGAARDGAARCVLNPKTLII